MHDACIKPSDIRQGTAPAEFVRALMEIYDRKFRRYRELVFRLHQLDTATTRAQIAAISSFIPADPPIRFRFCSDAAFYYSLDNAKGTGKGDGRELVAKGKGRGKPNSSGSVASSNEGVAEHGLVTYNGETFRPVSSGCVTPPAPSSAAAEQFEVSEDDDRRIPEPGECVTPPAL